MKTLNINGQNHQVDVPNDMPLLWVIRDIIGYTGTKFGCGKGLCGACMVLMDGQAINSCQIKANGIEEGTEIMTIEGKDDDLERLQKSWKSFNVPQCGFCQPGQLITATALLKKNSNPSDEQIKAELSRNICRCGTYERIRNAVKNA
ncbi:MAG: (2Fe-2S)-binding protein [Flavobacteriaceae bacterium]